MGSLKLISVPILILLTSVIPPDPVLSQPTCPISWPNSVGVPDYFYEFGQHIDSVVLPNDDGSSSEVQLTVQFPLFGEYRDILFVNTNGVLSFDRSFGPYTPSPFPIPGILLIAPYWADANTNINDGRAYYRQTTEYVVLCRASAFIRDKLVNFFNFQGTWAFVATWHNVTFYGGSSTTPVNTFQAILITNGRHGFTIFKYGNITWTTGRASGGDENGLGGTPAQVGFNAGDADNYFAVNTSRTHEIVNIDTDPSNTGDTGCWLFQTDNEVIIDRGCNVEGSLLLGPNYCQYLGGKKIYISGPCYNETVDQIVCKFGQYAVNGTVLDRNRACCITPRFDQVGTFDFEMSRDGGQSFDYTAKFYVDDEDEYFITREDDGLWLNEPFLNLSFTWDPTLYPADAELQVDILIIDNVTTGDVLVNILPSTDNDGEEMMPPTLLYTSPLEELAVLCVIRISQKNASALPIYLWSDVHPCDWYDAALFVELAIRAEDGQTLTPRETEIFEVIKETYDSVTPSGGTRRKRLIRELIDGIIRTAVPLIMGPLGATIYCEIWDYLEKTFPPDYEEVDPPPCTERQAARSGDYTVDKACNGNSPIGCYVFHRGATKCYRSTEPTKSGYGQQVCYDSNGDIIRNSFGGGGTFDKSHSSNVVKHFTDDVLPFLACCKNFLSNCQNYYDRRPTDQECMDPEPEGWTGGDPHITTLDNVAYTFNGLGEYSLLKAPDFDIQGRFSQLPGTTQATFLTALAIKVQNTVVQIRIALRQLHFGVSGSTEDYYGVRQYDINDNIRFTRTSALTGRVAVGVPGTTRCTATFDLMVVSNSLLLKFRESNTSCLQGQGGLFGKNDGNPDNDLTAANGIVLAINSSAEDIHYLFGETWRITEEESNLYYPMGTSYEEFNDPSYVPAFFDAATLLEMDDAGICGDNIECRYDLFVSGDTTIANITRMAVEDVAVSAQLFEEGQSPCFSRPCGNNGDCTIMDDTYQCACHDGYTGANCQTIIDICGSQPCQNNGMCEPQNAGNTFRCFCQTGFTGELCDEESDNEISACQASTCKNGGICFSAGFDFMCVCNNGFTGHTCEIGPEQTTAPMTTVEAPEQTTAPMTTAEAPDPCASSPCQNGGFCTIADDGATYKCACTAGYSGKDCEDVDTSNPCLPTSCKNGGTCYFLDSTISCVCPMGFIGPQCETALDGGGACSSEPCQNGGLCTTEEGSPAYKCLCPAGFYGESCELVSTTNPCLSMTCLNGGTCYHDTFTATCVCQAGFLGPKCETVLGGGACAAEPCENGGECMNMNTDQGYRCNCTEGYTGINCEKALVNPCNSAPCQNNGLCTIDDNSQMYTCLCTAGFSGTNCEIVDSTSPCLASPCDNGGTCYYINSEVSCVCQSGFIGQHCEKKVTDQNGCSSKPCQNGGLCTIESGASSYECLCTSGYLGQTCAIAATNNLCLTRTCLNGGMCYHTTSEAVCTCAAGYVGNHCEAELGGGPCTVSPCENSGVCTNEGNTYKCHCQPGYSGTNCEKVDNGCVSQPCQNFGACVSRGGGVYVCFCRRGFSGPMCQTGVPCVSDPCINGGYCYVDGDLEKCDCPEAFSGIHCHISAVDELTYVASAVTVFTVMAFVFLISLGLVLFVVVRRQPVVPVKPRNYVLRLNLRQ